MSTIFGYFSFFLKKFLTQSHHTVLSISVHSPSEWSSWWLQFPGWLSPCCSIHISLYLIPVSLSPSPPEFKIFIKIFIKVFIKPPHNSLKNLYTLFFLHLLIPSSIWLYNEDIMFSCRRKLKGITFFFLQVFQNLEKSFICYMTFLFPYFLLL